MSAARVERFAFTAFIKPPLKKYFSKVSFLIAGKEYTKEGRVHWQGYLELHKKLSLRKLKGLLGITTHIERAKKPAIANIRYCLKDLTLSLLSGNPTCVKARMFLAALLKAPELNREVTLHYSKEPFFQHASHEKKEKLQAKKEAITQDAIKKELPNRQAEAIAG